VRIAIFVCSIFLLQLKKPTSPPPTQQCKVVWTTEEEGEEEEEGEDACNMEENCEHVKTFLECLERLHG
jgi:hypothetical protein